jgi:transcriptional regulator with XRE-family HTH domain
LKNASKAVGVRIREIRKIKHISQENLAILAGVNRSHMGTIERGDKSSTVAMPGKIANALGWPIPSLFSGETT